MSWVVVTGASSGLGEQLVRVRSAGVPHLPKLEGIVLIARRREALEHLAEEISAQHPHVATLAIVADLSDPLSINHIEQSLAAQGIRGRDITEVYSNAGVGTIGPFVESSQDEIETMLSVNMVATTKLLHALMRDMVQGHADDPGRTYRICIIASVASFTPGPLMAVYYASKAFALSLGQALRREVKNQGIHVTVACPGPFDSAFHRNAGIRTSVPAHATAARVARVILRGVRRDRAVIPVGLGARLWGVLGPRLPRSWAREIMFRIQSRRS